MLSCIQGSEGVAGVNEPAWTFDLNRVKSSFFFCLLLLLLWVRLFHHTWNSGGSGPGGVPNQGVEL